MASGEPALVSALPALSRVPWARLGDLPTPVEELPSLGLFVKRDDLSGAPYGGNKVRTLETLFGEARARGATRIWATGAYGSNHAVATCLYARGAGFEPGVMLFPQPRTECAAENLVATLGATSLVRPLLSWATLPAAIWRERRRAGSYVMLPGGATPRGALGYVSAAFELAEQIRRGELPAPLRIVVGVGSTCTSAGLLAGTAIVAATGLGFTDRIPEIWSVRVTPWPVTSTWRIVSLAARAARLVADLSGDPRLVIGRAALAPRLRVIGGQIGRGYGYATAAGIDAIRRFHDAGGPPLDTCYSAKAAAGFFAHASGGPTLFWATKSSRPLPAATPEQLAAAPRAMRRWLARPNLPDPR